MKKKCYKCKKKLKLLNENLCSCKHIFCMKHRLCHEHDCEYIKNNNIKKKIELDNPKVECSKVIKF